MNEVEALVEACTARLSRELSQQGVEVTLVPGRGRRERLVRFRQRWRDHFRDPVVSTDPESDALDLLSIAGLPFTKELTHSTTCIPRTPDVLL